LEPLNIDGNYAFYTIIGLLLAEQVLYYLDFTYIYKFGIKIKEIPVESLVLHERKIRMNFLRFTERKDSILIRFSPPFGAIPLPFVGIIEKQRNNRLKVKIGPATLASIAVLLFQLCAYGRFGEVFYGTLVLVFVYFIFVRTTRDTIRT
jgi:hypothetical protein